MANNSSPRRRDDTYSSYQNSSSEYSGIHVGEETKHVLRHAAWHILKALFS